MCSIKTVMSDKQKVNAYGRSKINHLALMFWILKRTVASLSDLWSHGFVADVILA